MNPALFCWLPYSNSIATSIAPLKGGIGSRILEDRAARFLISNVLHILALDFKRTTYPGKEALQNFHIATAGVAGGGDIRGVQLAECCKHAVGVCDDGDKAGAADDGAAGAICRSWLRFSLLLGLGCFAS